MKDVRLSFTVTGRMEYRTAEVATAVVNKATGQMKYDWSNSHSSLAYVEHTRVGLKR